MGQPGLTFFQTGQAGSRPVTITMLINIGNLTEAGGFPRPPVFAFEQQLQREQASGASGFDVPAKPI